MKPIKQRASLSQTQIRQVCRQLGLGLVSRVAYMGAGQINGNYRVTTEVGDVVVRAYTMHTKKEILAELHALHMLSQHGFPCPQPVSGLLFVDKTPVVVFRYIPGKTISRNAVDTIREVGHLTAQLHILVEGYRFSYQREGEGVPTIKKYLHRHHRQIANSEVPRAAALVEALFDALPSIHIDMGLPRGLVHADIKPDNVVRSNDNTLWLLDFNNSYRDSLVVDVGATIIWWCIVNKKLDMKRTRAFLTAYQSIRPLSKKEKHNVAMAVRFALIKQAFKYAYIGMYMPQFAGKKAWHFLDVYQGMPEKFSLFT